MDGTVIENTYDTELLGKVTEEELREFYDGHPEIEEAIREWIRESDYYFVCEQIDELRDVIRFEVDAWYNVWAKPAVDAADCGDMAKAVRESIYSYPSATEVALAKLERYAEGAERLEYHGYYRLPDHFEKAVEEQMELICDVYAGNFHDEFLWWLDATSDDLFGDYFLDDPDEFIRMRPALERDIEDEKMMRQMEEDERKGRIAKHRKLAKRGRLERRVLNGMYNASGIKRRTVCY